jgi:hypothetical protein
MSTCEYAANFAIGIHRALTMQLDFAVGRWGCGRAVDRCPLAQVAFPPHCSSIANEGLGHEFSLGDGADGAR